MLILNIVVLTSVSFVTGYFIGKGNVTINKVAKKAERDEINAKYEQELKDAIEGYNNAVEEFNGLAKDIL